MKATVKTKVMVLASAAAILPLLATLALTLEFRGSVSGQAAREVNGIARENIRQVARDVYALCAAAEALKSGPGGREQAMAAARKAILQLEVGKSGYVGVIGTKGAARGRYFVSQHGRRDGENIWETRDPQGRPIIQHLVSRAATVRPGEIFFEEYPWRNPGDNADRIKINALVYFEPWDWLINAGAYQDEYQSAVATIDESVRGLLAKIAGGGFAALAIALGLAVFLSGRLARPLAVTATVAEKIAAGNVVEARREVAAYSGQADGGGHRLFGDETADLLKAFGAMTGNLDSLIGEVRRSGIQVNATARQIAASAHEMEAAAAEQAASTREVTATSKEISATSTDLMRTIEEMGTAVNEAGSRAEAGQADLARMRAAIDHLARSTDSIAAKLGIVSDRAGKISSVITTINKISDQTGMLALNAAIEAEKAGDYGRGFSVVAREIGRLADQTAAATEDIAAVIRDMQSSVSSGVMEMDKFSVEVRRRTEEVESVGTQLSGIIHQVQTLGAPFDALRQGMRGQAESAQQISEAMTQLTETAERTRQSVAEFKSATDQLNSALESLQKEVGRFHITA